jgi:hypothetical protein
MGAPPYYYYTHIPMVWEFRAFLAASFPQPYHHLSTASAPTHALQAPLGFLNRMMEATDEYYWRKKEEKQRQKENEKEGKAKKATQKVFDDAAAANVPHR